MKLRIAFVHDLWHEIPRVKYGGSERVLYSLIEGLCKKGQDVTLYGTGTSHTSAKLIPMYSRGMFDDGIARTNLIYPLLSITEALDHEKDYDIIHFHMNVESDYPSLPLAMPFKDKTVFTLHFAAPSLKGYPDRDIFLKKYKDLHYISISNAQRKGMEFLNFVETVYNGIDLDQFTFNERPQEYFLWLGKFNPDKGAKLAIEAAKKAGVKLKIAGAVDKLDGIDYHYYNDEVKPLIDGKQIEYVGEVGGKEKDELFGNAIAFLNPILWNEPFGLVMTEAMATGTPVISFRNGAAPELIEDDVTGYLVNDVNEMVEKMKNVQTLDRKACRKQVEEKFSSNSMVEHYLQVYEQLVRSQKLDARS